MSEIDAKLGNVDDVAAGAAAEFARSRWARRHPLVAFGLLPGPLVVGLFLGVSAALVLPFAAVESLTGGELPRSVGVAWASVFLYGTSFLPFVIAAAWYAPLARRTGVAWGWVALGLIQVLLAAAALVPTLKSSEVPGQSFLFVAIAGTDARGIFLG